MLRTACRIEHQKGQHLLFDAMALLKKRGLKTNATVFGNVMDEEYKTKLTNQIKEFNLENHIHFYGFHSDPTSVMPCFDVIVMPSKNETFGLVLVEAMLANVPVIATNAGGVPEIIDHEKTGLLFKWGDCEDLANQLEKLISDEKLRKQLAKNGKTNAQQLFDYNTHFKRLETLFKTV